MAVLKRFMDSLLQSQSALKMLHSPLSKSNVNLPLFFPFTSQSPDSSLASRDLRFRSSNKASSGSRGALLETEKQLQILEDSPGKASPLGVSEVENGINFAIFSQHATAATLCLWLPGREGSDPVDREMTEYRLDPKVNKTGNGLPRKDVLYGYRMDGPRDWKQGHRFEKDTVLVDPYSKLVEGRRYFGDKPDPVSKFLGTYDFDSPSFDWGEDYAYPNIPEKDLVIYEMNVRAFTMDVSSGLDPSVSGSYLGVIEKIPHLLELGVNAVELLPVFEYDEMEFQRHPNPRDHMVNTWGYSTINFFAPMSRYASAGGGPINASIELKKMVKALHDAGIEVIH
ncbi:hypothetical protein V2J09_024148 [Rumex salicifolius]